jgi:glycosyltransferase A (GT-A) superfamily protein (DUF2064 family)
MSAGIAIFVKTPGHSPLKTRLAAVAGTAFAEQWHARAAGAVAAVAREACRGGAAQAYWAVAEPEALADPRWAGLPVIGQGDGGLGVRMHHVHQALHERHPGGILLGADCPQVAPDLLRQALAWLDSPQPRLAIGPAQDGGFWLFGANRRLPLACWESVTYSAADTGARFRAVLDGLGEWLELPVLRDVDTADDLPACVAALRTLATPLPAQIALRDWMEAQAPAGVLHA